MTKRYLWVLGLAAVLGLSVTVAQDKKDGGAVPAKAAETKTKANATPGDPGSVSAGESADAANAGESPAPESEEPVDLSWAPDSVKQEIEKAKLSKAALNALKSGFRGRKEITQRFQEIAAVKRDADNWRAATSDPEKAKRIVDILTRQDEPAPVAEPEVDAAQFDPLDPVSVAKFTAAQAPKVAAAGFFTQDICHFHRHRRSKQQQRQPQPQPAYLQAEQQHHLRHKQHRVYGVQLVFVHRRRSRIQPIAIQVKVQPVDTRDPGKNPQTAHSPEQRRKSGFHVQTLWQGRKQLWLRRQ